MKRSDLINVIYAARNAAQGVVDNWEKGDLAAAVRELDAVLQHDIADAIKWWESDE